MTVPVTVWGLVALAIATTLVAGVFLTFSDFVMKSLFASKPAAGTEAMQIINRKVYHSLFMVLLIGLIPVSVLIAGYGYFYMQGAIATALAFGGALYFFGVFLVSMGGNIPMNRLLESMSQGGADAQAYWPEYVRGWVLWNHVRWITATGTAICYMIGAILLVQSA